MKISIHLSYKKSNAASSCILSYSFSTKYQFCGLHDESVNDFISTKSKIFFYFIFIADVPTSPNTPTAESKYGKSTTIYCTSTNCFLKNPSRKKLSLISPLLLKKINHCTTSFLRIQRQLVKAYLLAC